MNKQHPTLCINVIKFNSKLAIMTVKNTNSAICDVETKLMLQEDPDRLGEMCPGRQAEVADKAPVSAATELPTGCPFWKSKGPCLTSVRTVEDEPESGQAVPFSNRGSQSELDAEALETAWVTDC